MDKQFLFTCLVHGETISHTSEPCCDLAFLEDIMEDY